jgi:hypothetical protein
MKRPHRLFRSRPNPAPEVVSLERRGKLLTMGRPFLPSVAAWVEVNRSRFKPGTLANIIVEHDPGCRYPEGRPCSCSNGPQIRTEGLESANN